MALNYQLSTERIRNRLIVAHSKKAKICAKFFTAENRFFKEHIYNQAVLVAGSGLGHDSFELAKFNKKITGIELLELLVQESKKIAEKRNVRNVSFELGNIAALRYPVNKFNTVVLNMGTFGNFDNKKKILSELLRVAKTVYFDFYLPTRAGFSERIKMYAQEKWVNPRVEKSAIVSDDGLYSASLSKKEVRKIVRALNANVKFYHFHPFAVMAEVTKK